MKRWRLGGAPVDAAIEIERFASFDHQTRRFIAYAISLVPELADYVGNPAGVAGNIPARFILGSDEHAERVAAYETIPRLRAFQARGREGQRQRRHNFGDMLAMARIDVRWKRLNDPASFIFCYERLVGGQWRELLVPCWIEAAHQRRKRGPVQLPLDRRLREDSSVPKLLEDDAPPVFYPSMADADALTMPLLTGL